MVLLCCAGAEIPLDNFQQRNAALQEAIMSEVIRGSVAIREKSTGSRDEPVNATLSCYTSLTALRLWLLR
jgi:hypothetical protein